MKNQIKEILTHEIYNEFNSYYLHVPVQNLLQPRFLIKRNNLYIFLNDYKRGYVVKNLPYEIVEAILLNNCYLCEAISPELTQHSIALYP